MRERLIILFQNLVTWFALWYLLYGSANEATGVGLLTGEIIIPGVFFYFVGVKLTMVEKTALTRTYAALIVFNLYMVLCLFSVPVWVYNHNLKMGVFIAANAIIYLLPRENR